ncbi:helix-turn-helix domain-containing protein [Nitrosovibrio sp. Nv17]|uniref:helix-turn-helix domain-containing protein n=1 Tax=Nitrosovibrio sp. Nv17 TaxID=1855339 RepID=UPI000908ED38|nr:helix-turn-helix transcriptional regulator [Nitrosovibrio sp. Nv17]SFW21206.1 transcriptional regulator, XRE family [Nitrosovibrio sp. Nv17]
MTQDIENTIMRGSENIFADLGYVDAETHLLKAGLVSRIQDVIHAQKMTQTVAAKRMGLSQPDVSRLLKGHFRDISVERLMRMLTKLGYEVDIVIREHGKKPSRRNIIRLGALAHASA